MFTSFKNRISQLRVVPKTKMRTNKLLLIRKLTTAEEAIDADNIKATARKWNVFPTQIIKWKLKITGIFIQIVRIAFQGCGYVYEEGAYCEMDTESESEIDNNNR